MIGVLGRGIPDVWLEGEDTLTMDAPTVKWGYFDSDIILH
jgi:hypothetical protein